MISDCVPSPILQAMAVLDAAGNDHKAAIELAMLAVDHRAEDAEFAMRLEVVKLLLAERGFDA
jgi:hypothetical protein